MARVSVVMPAFEQAWFVPRAFAALAAQTLGDWELVAVDDGSRDSTPGVLASLAAADPRVQVVTLPSNSGLGAALNAGLAAARAPVVAYLPCDDVYDDPGHLGDLVAVLADPAVALAHAGVRHHGELTDLGAPAGFALQLVQVAHRAGALRWTERGELETDDLDLLGWDRVRATGEVRGTGRVTCTWTDHPGQRHKAIRERFDGGPNVYRQRYRVAAPLRLRTSDGTDLDEVARYAPARARTRPVAPDGLSILLVGELSYHPDRVLAFAERGHRLAGLWTQQPLGHSTVGPVPFGHVRDLPAQGWRDAVRELAPDVVHAQLNFRAVQVALEVRRAFPRLPFVWHFKEAPQRSIARGDWPALAELMTTADAVVLSTPLEREWFELALPGRLDPARTLVVDGNLPKADWSTGELPPRLSDADGEVHTVVLGRPLGFDPPFLAALAAQGVHVHFHGLRDGPGPQGTWRAWLDEARRVAPAHVHLHPAVDERGWVSVLGRYDAGWLHRFTSTNGGDVRRATWDDLNLPARIGTLVAARLPLLVQANPGHAVAVEALAATGVGLTYTDADSASARLTGPDLPAARAEVARRRGEFTFDAHADRLLTLFRSLL
ncbi:MAG TPA: glycosyltransferase family 2 protein [Kineosporiaceae bacterium]|nr:glycosyltransferase family 2 protein [Kineosporiaceae bacterium]